MYQAWTIKSVYRGELYKFNMNSEKLSYGYVVVVVARIL